jgi:hypothetical protein
MCEVCLNVRELANSEPGRFIEAAASNKTLNDLVYKNKALFN